MSGVSIPPSVREVARSVAGAVRDLRRALHRRPEPSGREHRTAETVERALRDLDLAPRRLTETGIVADLEGSAPGPSLLVRADIDALEIHEETGLEFASEVPGMMHACGHDAHTAILVGAGRALLDLRKELRGRVRLLFQPHEESSPGGALPMISAGALDGIDAALALHVYPHVDVGRIQVSAGPQTANSDDLEIEIVGRGGHAASPHEARDPIVAAASIIQSLQTIASRRIDPLEPVVVTIGKVEAGSRRNIIPERARLEGTVRTFSAEAREAARRAVEEIVRSVAAAHGVEARVAYDLGYPVVVNDARVAKIVEEAAAQAIGAENVDPVDRPTMGGEDFAYFAERVPACMFRLGCGAGAIEARFPHHHPRFTVDERCLEVGVAVFAAAALRFGRTWG